MAAQHLVLPAQVKNLEFQLQMWNSALQVGTLVTHCHLWVTGSNPELWLGFLSAHSGLAAELPEIRVWAPGNLLFTADVIATDSF